MGNLIIFLLFDIYAMVSFYIINYATANNPVGQSLSLVVSFEKLM